MVEEFFNVKAAMDSVDLRPWGVHITVDMLREDALHPTVSGNKMRKLKHWAAAVVQENRKGILTLGGAFSNHILATAAVCKMQGWRCVLLVRAAEENPGSATLRLAREMGAEIVSLSRTAYRQRNDPEFVKHYTAQYSDLIWVPEGGSGATGQQGVADMVDARFQNYRYVCVSVGTGGTFLGLHQGLAAYPFPKLMGFAAVPQKYLDAGFVQRHANHLHFDYLFGGYAKITPELVAFIREFWEETQIILDPVYTGKMMFGIIEALKAGSLTGGRLLCIHTGGLQGLLGMPDHFSWCYPHLPQALVGKQ